MTPLRNATVLLAAALLLSLPLFGQTVSYTLALTDNTAWCATGNCLTALPTTPGTLTEIKTGYDGTTYVLDAALPYTLSPARVWTKVPTALQTAGGYPITHISVGSKAQVMALNSAAYPAYNVYVLNSAGTAWQAQTGWLSNAEIGADGTIVGTGSDGNTWADIGGAWSKLAAGSPSIFAVADAYSIWAVSTSSVIENWNGTGWTALSPTPSFTPSRTLNGIAAAGEQALAVLDASGGIHLSTNAGATWSTIQGTASSITGGGVHLFTRNGSASYHVNLLVPALTVTATQNFYCFGLDGGQEDCGNASLTATAFVGGAASTTNSITEPGTITASATAQGYTCDLFYDPDGTGCTAYDEGDSVYLCDVTIGQGDVPGDCYSSAGPFGLAFSAGASETLYALATKTCSWNKSCPVGQTATCGVGTIYGPPPCANFEELYFVWYNFGAGNVCVQYGPVIASSIPVGGCD
jgi:hypothetical protein